MTRSKTSESGFGLRAAVVVLSLAALLAILGFFARPVWRFIRESLMQRVTSAHYEIRCPPGVLPPEIMRQFASQRETLFTALDRRLDDAGSNAEIQIIFYGDSRAPGAAATTAQTYVVTGTTIRTKVNGLIPKLDSAADAEALLDAAWGKPGDPRMGRWAAIWLVGEWREEELGMAAAAIEQRLGHEKVSSLLDPASSEISSPEDRALLGAAWLSEIAELDGPAEVRKLYAAKTPAFDEAEAAKTLGTTPLELNRKWQMWMYAYLAGMPPAPRSMTMPSQ